MNVLIIYKNNPELRAEYFKRNKIKHCEVYKYDGHWEVMACSGPGTGLFEFQAATKKEAINWTKEFMPELEIVFT